ncbi:MAG: hypothetical protein ACR2N2_12195 [Acidimicrobiia bacterium]
MNPMRSRPWRTVILTVSGFALAWLIALLLAPFLPEYCNETPTGMSCTRAQIQTMAGYLTIGLGIATIVLGPVAGSLIDLYLNGARWETPRGTETIITNMPLVIGAIFLGVGVLTAATA